MSRASDTAPPAAFLTTREVAELLRLKERRVYALAARGEIPCTRATGRLLFPREAILRRLASGEREPGTGGAPVTAPGLLAGSHDPLLEWAVRQSESGLPTLFDGSLDGLGRLARGEAAAAGLHLFDPASGEWNVAACREYLSQRPVVLLEWACRQRGLVVPPDNPAGIAALRDLAGRRVVRRQSGSGAQRLFEALLVEAAVPESAIVWIDPVARSEMELAEAVARGEAEAGFGLGCVARSFGLGFVPLLEERFDIAVDRRGFFEEPFQKLLAFTRGPAFRARAESLGGYRIDGLWRVRWLAP